MCTSVNPLQSRGSVSDPLRAKAITEMDLDGVGEVLCAQNDGNTSVDNQSGCDLEAVLHVF
jgi:hypothetical protein